MLSGRFSVILDIGHGPGTRDPDGSTGRGRSERSVCEEVVEAAMRHLAAAGVSVRVVRSGPYRERQTDPLVTTADLWLSVHADKQDERWNPYALALALPHSQDAAGRLVSVYAAATKLRKIVAEPGVGDWMRGRDLIRHVPEHVPAVLLELGSLSHAECDRLWLDPEGTGLAVATAARAVLV